MKTKWGAILWEKLKLPWSCEVMEGLVRLLVITFREQLCLTPGSWHFLFLPFTGLSYPGPQGIKQNFWKSLCIQTHHCVTKWKIHHKIMELQKTPCWISWQTASWRRSKNPGLAGVSLLSLVLPEQSGPGGSWNMGAFIQSDSTYSAWWWSRKTLPSHHIFTA